MIAMARHTHCPVHKVTIEDIHIQAGTGRIVVLPTFIWRSTRRAPAPPPDGSPVSADVANPATLVPLLAAKNFTVQGCSWDNEGGASDSLDESDSAQAWSAPLLEAEELAFGSGVGEPSDSKDGSISVRTGTQEGLLAAWVRIVLELYTRNAQVAEWTPAQLREALPHATVPEDAAALLSICVDEARPRPAARPCVLGSFATDRGSCYCSARHRLQAAQCSCLLKQLSDQVASCAQA
jgi:hypothetical protein